jgi:hypothetical protein
VTTLPPWLVTARGANERAAQVAKMAAWVNAQLDAQLDREHLDRQANSSPADRASYLEWLRTYGPQIDAARRGDIKPLQKLFPMLKEFLVAPTPRKRTKCKTKMDHIQTKFAASSLRDSPAKRSGDYGNRSSNAGANPANEA